MTGLPAQFADAVRNSVFAGVEVARELDSAVLLGSVRGAFVHGLDLMLWTSAAVAFVGVALALAFLPSRTTQGAVEGARPAQSDHEVTV